ncbi:hypothetical protein [Paracoccus beibuensis]|uniref:hypothetical protein n=1 Tax=Paracoccus beibuensis TaxID=547602 RepID=UPI00223F42FC|nr:hypothetical protein [Paracoccus beibuensis]
MEQQQCPAIPEAELDQISFQNWGGLLMGTAISTPDSTILQHMRTLKGLGAITLDVIRYVKEGFGQPLPERTTPASLVFTPDTDQEGFWYSNLYNWPDHTIPGTHSGDTFNLAGNYCRFNHETVTVASAKFSGGRMDYVGGRQTIGTLLDAANISVHRAGQVYIGSSAFPLKIGAVAGRVKLNGTFTNLNGRFIGKSQTLLGTSATVPAGETLTLSGTRVEFGWDGPTGGTLNIEGTLKLRAGVTLRVTDNYYKTAEANSGEIAERSDGTRIGIITDMYDTAGRLCLGPGGNWLAA